MFSKVVLCVCVRELLGVPFVNRKAKKGEFKYFGIKEGWGDWRRNKIPSI